VEKNPQEYASTYSFTVYLFHENEITSFSFCTCSCILLVTHIFCNNINFPLTVHVRHFAQISVPFWR